MQLVQCVANMIHGLTDSTSVFCHDFQGKENVNSYLRLG